MRFTLPLLLALAHTCLVLPARAQGTNAKCPIMTDEEADPEMATEFEGERVLLCCEKCTKLWKGQEKYIIKLCPDILTQYKGKEAALGLDKVELLPQKYCPINKDQIVMPNSPTVEYQGQKIYFSNEKAVEKWKADPAAAAAKAKGLLPQLTEKPAKKE